MLLIPASPVWRLTERWCRIRNIVWIQLPSIRLQAQQAKSKSSPSSLVLLFHTMYGSELPNEKSQLCVVSIGSSEGGRVDFKHSRASFQRNWPNFHSWLMVAHRDTLENDQGWNVMFTMSVAAQLCIQTSVHTDRCLESRHVLFGDVSASEDVDCWSNKVGFCCSNLISETKPARVLLSHVSSCSRSRLTLLTLLGADYMHCDWSMYCFSLSAWRQANVRACTYCVKIHRAW